mmetsp:Transcript_14461/g.42202  ORF Transcript_14461/g.42202 Transcript_14461/m.42202 type:complete len:276 (-) Transcript_14461:1874-2701(-)
MLALTLPPDAGCAAMGGATGGAEAGSGEGPSWVESVCVCAGVQTFVFLEETDACGKAVAAAGPSSKASETGGLGLSLGIWAGTRVATTSSLIARGWTLCLQLVVLVPSGGVRPSAAGPLILAAAGGGADCAGPCGRAILEAGDSAGPADREGTDAETSAALANEAEPTALPTPGVVAGTAVTAVGTTPSWGVSKVCICMSGVLPVASALEPDPPDAGGMSSAPLTLAVRSGGAGGCFAPTRLPWVGCRRKACRLFLDPFGVASSSRSNASMSISL